MPAYLSFAEPVVACFIVAALVLDKLSDQPVARAFRFVLLVLLLRGVLFPLLIYVFYAKTNVLTALVSVGRFSLEECVLALLTIVTWQFCEKSEFRTGWGEG